MRSYNLYLIRNGLTAENLDGQYIGRTNVSLCEEGREQLRQLRRELIYPGVDALISSPLARCAETAEILFPDKKPIFIDGFAECDFGEFEGLTADELKDEEDFKNWLSGGGDAAPPHGESNEQFSKRVCSTFERVVEAFLKTGTMNTAIITHGGVIMALLAAYGLPELPMHQWVSPAGCGYAVRIDPRLWTTIKKFEVYSEFPFEREELTD